MQPPYKVMCNISTLRASIKVETQNRKSMNTTPTISQMIRDHFPDLAILKDRRNDVLFTGRALPAFVKDYIIRKFSDDQGKVDDEAVRNYLDQRMPDAATLRTRLLLEGTVKLTTRFIVKSDLAEGKVAFAIPDAEINRRAYISQTVLKTHAADLKDGEVWGAITLEYMPPKGREDAYIVMTEFQSFKPYKPSIDFLCEARNNFTLEQWVDVLIAAMEYNPDSFESLEQKMEFISRLLPFVEPRVHLIEFGPKGSGKTYIYSNLSKYVWALGGGKTSRARLFHNFKTGQHGAIMFYDAVAIDEISTFSMSEPDELESIMKGFLEEGSVKLEKINLRSDCGLVLMGNIKLSENREPLSQEYFMVLPKVFRSSALMDRFSGFIEGWKLPRLTSSSILQGWTLNSEYFSTVLHMMRTESVYGQIFDDIVSCQEGADLRDNKAVKRLATAYCKLLFPNMRCAVSELDPQEQENFKALYLKYCLEPAVRRRGIIRQQLYLMDKEFTPDMPEYSIYLAPELPDPIDDFGGDDGEPIDTETPDLDLGGDDAPIDTEAPDLEVGDEGDYVPETPKPELPEGVDDDKFFGAIKS